MEMGKECAKGGGGGEGDGETIQEIRGYNQDKSFGKV